MNKQYAAMLTLLVSAALAGCGSEGGGAPEGATTGSAASEKTYVFGVLAKAQWNPVFKAARAGAEQAAADIEAQNPGVTVDIDWRAPSEDDAQKQVEFVELLTSQGVDGIAISVSDATLLNGPLQTAVGSDVPVVTYDSDAPASGRFAYYGMDDAAAGTKVMEELAGQMGGEGIVAVLSGNPNSANLAARVEGVLEQAANYDGIEIRGVYNEPTEKAAEMAAKMQQVQASEPDITGWALVGGWPLYTENSLDGIYSNAKVVSIDALPLPLEYVRQGQAQVLIGQPYFGWGYESVMMLFEFAHNGQEPEQVLNYADFDVVTAENVEEFAGRWDEWLEGVAGGN
ncbi:MAG: substrate-binding domain-containing protein [Planctomycetota bacterium]